MSIRELPGSGAGCDEAPTSHDEPFLFEAWWLGQRPALIRGSHLLISSLTLLLVLLSLLLRRLLSFISHVTLVGE